MSRLIPRGRSASLFRTHHRRLVGLAALLYDDLATSEDVVQEAFAGLYRRWWQLRDPHSAVVYLNRAVVNGGRDHLRRGRLADASMLRMVPQPEALSSAEQYVMARDEGDRCGRPSGRCHSDRARCSSCATTSIRARPRLPRRSTFHGGSVKRHASRGLAALARCLEVAQ